MKDSPKDKFKYLDNIVALAHGGNLEKSSWINNEAEDQNDRKSDSSARY